MGKNPSFSFFPGDWTRDTAILSDSAARCWIDLLCAMWWSEKRGKICLNLDEIARLLRRSKIAAKKALKELFEKNICDHSEDENGNITLISRRMMRDQAERDRWCESKEMSRKCPANVPEMSRKCPDPSSKASKASDLQSSIVLENKKLFSKTHPQKGGLAYSADFLLFWEDKLNWLDKSCGKRASSQAFWKAKSQGAPSAAELLVVLSIQDAWRQAIPETKRPNPPHVTTWLNQCRWDAEAPPIRGPDPTVAWLEERRLKKEKESEK